MCAHSLILGRPGRCKPDRPPLQRARMSRARRGGCLSEQHTTNLDDLQADIDERADAEIRASIAAGAPVNAWVLAGMVAEWWQAAGVDCLERPRWHREQARQCQARIDELRRVVAPAPAAPTNQHAKDEAGLLAGSRALDFDLCQCMGEPMIRESGGEWEILTRRSNARERLFRALQRECVDTAGHPWRIRYRDDEYRLLVGTCSTNPLAVAVAFAGKVAAVTNWANEQTGGNFLFGDIAHAVGLVDRFVGSAKYGRLNAEIIRAGLAAADGAWEYGDVRLKTGGHGERWKCPRQRGVKLAPKRRKRGKPTP